MTTRDVPPQSLSGKRMLLTRSIRNRIHYFFFELYGILEKDREKSTFHTSGHINVPGIEEAVEIIKPRILIPVHTLKREFFQRFEGLYKVVLPGKGETLLIEKVL